MSTTEKPIRDNASDVYEKDIEGAHSKFLQVSILIGHGNDSPDDRVDVWSVPRTSEQKFVMRSVVAMAYG